MPANVVRPARMTALARTIAAIARYESTLAMADAADRAEIGNPTSRRLRGRAKATQGRFLDAADDLVDALMSTRSRAIEHGGRVYRAVACESLVGEPMIVAVGPSRRLTGGCGGRHRLTSKPICVL